MLNPRKFSTAKIEVHTVCIFVHLMTINYVLVCVFLIVFLDFCHSCVCIYIYIRISVQSTWDTSIAQLLPGLHWRIGQLRAPLQWNPQHICTHKHFNALGCIHIFAGIAHSSVGGLHGFCQLAILAYIILPVWLRPLPLLSRGGGAYKCTPLDSLLGKTKYVVSIGKQAHAIAKTKDLYSAYCPTGECTHHPLFCSSLSTARLLHFYVCPSLHPAMCISILTSMLLTPYSFSTDACVCVNVRCGRSWSSACQLMHSTCVG